MPSNHQEIILHTDDSYSSVIETIYGVTEDEAQERLKIIMYWYNLQPHFPKLDQEPNFLYRYLSMNRFNLDVTKRKLENFFSVRTAMPEFFSNRDPLNEQLQTAFDSINWIILPWMTPERERILILKLRKTNQAHLYDAVGAYKLLFLMIDFRFMYDSSVTDRFILDGTDCQIDHIIRTPPSILKKVAYVVQNCYAGRIRGLHFINCPAYMNSLVTFSKTLMKKKIADKYHFHKTLEDLHRFIPAKYLTKEYGGNDVTNEDISNNIRKAFESEDLRKRFILSENLKSDESKRLSDNQWSMDDILGISGTFRKLEVD